MTRGAPAWRKIGSQARRGGGSRRARGGATSPGTPRLEQPVTYEEWEGTAPEREDPGRSAPRVPDRARQCALCGHAGLADVRELMRHWPFKKKGEPTGGLDRLDQCEHCGGIQPTWPCVNEAEDHEFALGSARVANDSPRKSRDASSVPVLRGREWHSGPRSCASKWPKKTDQPALHSLPTETTRKTNPAVPRSYGLRPSWSRSHG